MHFYTILSWAGKRPYRESSFILKSMQNCKINCPNKFGRTQACIHPLTPNCHCDNYVLLTTSGLDNERYGKSCLKIPLSSILGNTIYFYSQFVEKILREKKKKILIMMLITTFSFQIVIIHNFNKPVQKSFCDQFVSGCKNRSYSKCVGISHGKSEVLFFTNSTCLTVAPVPIQNNNNSTSCSFPDISTSCCCYCPFCT